jgi:hypothetical protein
MAQNPEPLAAPTGTVIEVMAEDPLIWKSGPLGTIAAVAELTAVVAWAGADVLPNPGTHVPVMLEHNH